MEEFLSAPNDDTKPKYLHPFDFATSAVFST